MHLHRSYHIRDKGTRLTLGIYDRRGGATACEPLDTRLTLGRTWPGWLTPQADAGVIENAAATPKLVISSTFAAAPWNQS